MKELLHAHESAGTVVPAVQALSLLKGQTALVTGANSGIGRAIAIALGRAGATWS
jgi:glucose 1-dehydrogenase